jgi:hypothetical protein
MARTISEIQQSIVAAKEADGTLSGLTSSSAVAIWLLWTWIIATCQWVTESLYDAHVSEVQGIIALQKPHTLQWYATMAKAFQYGYALPAGSDLYDPAAPAGDASLVISYAAAVELEGQVRIKVAGYTAGVLLALTGAQLAAFTAYMQAVKDAGVLLQITSGNPDNLQLALNIYYDPLIINATGQRIDGTENTPVPDAINTFLANLPFNGVFMLNSLIAAGQAVSGVLIFEVVGCQANYAATPYVNILTATPNVYVPDAGYMLLDETYFGANVNYIAY